MNLGLQNRRALVMGGVDILVLNHGGPPQCTASEMKEADLVKWFQHIVVSPIRIANRLLPAMRARGWGRIIVVGSTGIQQPIPNLALSNTLCASIWAWLKTLSGEVAPDGVTMNVLAPGTILTDRTKESAGALAMRKNIRRGPNITASERPSPNRHGSAPPRRA